MNLRTFRSFYDKARKRPSPTAAFIAEIARVANRRPATIRKWLSGHSKPKDIAVLTALSKHFGVPPEELFPENK